MNWVGIAGEAAVQAIGNVPSTWVLCPSRMVMVSASGAFDKDFLNIYRIITAGEDDVKGSFTDRVQLFPLDLHFPLSYTFLK